MYNAVHLLTESNYMSKNAIITVENLVKNYGSFQAVKGISFDVNKGDRIGIIGRNGAGKSTLLKILSRITESSKGSIKIKGRIASLLEVGTGFHPELTGRENIFFNGFNWSGNRNHDRLLDADGK